jgi:VanZ like family/Concanavalin A-like lectin/glucanases superfamily
VFGLKVSSVLLKVLCGFVLCGILVAGLWPFHAPRNEVRWLSNGSGLFFGDYGSIVSAEDFKQSASSPCSLEIWLKPVVADYSGTILAFYGPDKHAALFSVRQSLGDLVIEEPNPDRSQRRRRTRIYVDDLFSQARLIFITITSGPAGTAVYADGSLAKQSAIFRFSGQELTGRILIGNAPTTTDNWSGQVKGLAIYDRDLTPNEVSQHHENWMKNNQADLAKSPGVRALYPFNEGSGNIVHNQVNGGTDLFIPERFFVLQEQFLELPWDEFYPGWNYWKDVGINVAGFIPLGFCFFAYFSSVRMINRPVLVTILLGFVASLTIEVLQSVLPTRNSGTTDLITNTFGTALGAILCVWCVKHNWFVRSDISQWVLRSEHQKKTFSSSSS